MQPLREQEVGVSKGRDYQVSAWFEVKTPYNEQTGRYEPMQVAHQQAIEEALDTLRSVGANLKVTIKEKNQGEARQWPIALNAKVFINGNKTEKPVGENVINSWDRFR
tara:strand:- start:469 stop:792 length:324 start_codon:yes stop_codon:yes gene_type:complete